MNIDFYRVKGELRPVWAAAREPEPLYRDARGGDELDAILGHRGDGGAKRGGLHFRRPEVVEISEGPVHGDLPQAVEPLHIGLIRDGHQDGFSSLLRTPHGEDLHARGCLLERTWRGSEPLLLPDGTERRFLEDGDEVTLVGRCSADGAVPIGLGYATRIYRLAPDALGGLMAVLDAATAQLPRTGGQRRAQRGKGG